MNRQIGSGLPQLFRLPFGRLAGNAAAGAESTDQPLCDDPGQCSADEEGFTADVDKAGDCTTGGVGVQGRKDHVARHCRLHGHVGGFHVTDLADHHHVGIVSEQGAQCRGKRHLVGSADVHLADTRDQVLDRIFDGQDIDVWLIEFSQCCVQRGGLSTSGRTGQQDHAEWLADGGFELLQHVLGHSEIGQRKVGGFGSQQSHRCPLAPAGGCRGHPDVELIDVVARDLV